MQEKAVLENTTTHDKPGYSQTAEDNRGYPNSRFKPGCSLNHSTNLTVFFQHYDSSHGRLRVPGKNDIHVVVTHFLVS